MANPKYTEWLTKEGLTLIEGWAREGLSNEQIAKNMGIKARTLYVWKNDHVQISQALKKGKEVSDFEIENALFKRASGFSEMLRKAKVLSDGTVVYYDEAVYFPPDTAATIFWLKNRKAENWKNNPEERQGEKYVVNIMPPPRPEVEEE